MHLGAVICHFLTSSCAPDASLGFLNYLLLQIKPKSSSESHSRQHVMYHLIAFPFNYVFFFPKAVISPQLKVEWKQCTTLPCAFISVGHSTSCGCTTRRSFSELMISKDAALLTCQRRDLSFSILFCHIWFNFHMTKTEIKPTATRCLQMVFPEETEAAMFWLIVRLQFEQKRHRVSLTDLMRSHGFLLDSHKELKI